MVKESLNFDLYYKSVILELTEVFIFRELASLYLHNFHCKCALKEIRGCKM